MHQELPDEAKVLLDHALQQLGIDDYEQVGLEAVGHSDIPLLYFDLHRIDVTGSNAWPTNPTWTIKIKDDYLEWIDTHWRGCRFDFSAGKWIVYYEGPTCL